jgi:F-type H+-transporting ATPase subunit b
VAGKGRRPGDRLRSIIAQAQDLGRVEREKILDQARRQAERIQEDAHRAADQELLRAKAELREESVRLAMGLAEKTLKEKVEPGDQRRLLEEYLRMIGRAS